MKFLGDQLVPYECIFFFKDKGVVTMKKHCQFFNSQETNSATTGGTLPVRDFKLSE